MAAPLLKDVLPRKICKGLIKLFKHAVQDQEYFGEKYTIISEDGFPKAIRCGKILKVRCLETSSVYAIKKIKIDEDSVRQYPHVDLFVQACQESVILKELDLQDDTIVKNHHKLNWIVFPDDLCATDVCEVLDEGADAPLACLGNFLGTEFYLVFEWYPNDLSDLMQCGDRGAAGGCNVVAIPSKKVTNDILLTILYGLVFIHRHGYIHNDLKPNNILISYKSHIQQHCAVIADFGFCQHLSSSTHKERTCRQQYDAPDRRFSYGIDIWSFGIVSFHLFFITTRRTSLASSDFDKLRELAQEGHLELRKFVKEMLCNVNGIFVEAVIQCLHINPKYRPSARVVYQVLSDDASCRTAYRTAKDFHQRMGPDCIYVKEEIMFPLWFDEIFLKAIANSTLSAEIKSMLTDISHEYDFPLAAVYQRFDQITIDLMAGMVGSL